MSCECRELTLQQMASLTAALQQSNEALLQFAVLIISLDNGAILHGIEPLPDEYQLLLGEQDQTLLDVGMLRKAKEAYRNAAQACHDVGAMVLPSKPEPPAQEPRT